jgi:hypothetical protein
MKHFRSKTSEEQMLGLIEVMTTDSFREAGNSVGEARLQDLRYGGVSNRQILSALLKEVDVPGSNGFLYKVLQMVANEARERGLLINPNQYTRETYSTSVGNTNKMLPSEIGWEQTKGILRRLLVLAKTLVATPRTIGVRTH